jgi:hypothetical protein
LAEGAGFGGGSGGSTGPTNNPGTSRSPSGSSKGDSKEKKRKSDSPVPAPAVIRAETAFEAAGPPPPETEIPPAVARAEEAFEEAWPHPIVEHNVPQNSTSGEEAISSGEEIGAPKSYIDNLFHDPDADINGTELASITVGQPPFEVNNPSRLGLDGGGGKLGWLVQFLNLARSLASYIASSDYSESSQPDVNLTLHYSVELDEEVRLPGVVVDNGSDSTLSLEEVIAEGQDFKRVMYPSDMSEAGSFFWPPSVSSNQTRVFSLQSRDSHIPDQRPLRVAVRVYVDGYIIVVPFEIPAGSGETETDL